MNFSKLDDLIDHMSDRIMENTELEDRGHRFWICGSLFGSQLYHPEYAKDYDIVVILSGVFSKPFYTSMITSENYTLNGIPCDIKAGSFNDLDDTELLELDYCFKNNQYVLIDSSTFNFNPNRVLMDATEIALSNKTKMRHGVSQKCSNSFVKAKKKLTVEKDYDRYASMKSLFHCIRMANFACRYAKSGIIDPQECKTIYEDIVDFYDSHSDEEVLYEITSGKYKYLYNETMSKFRLYYPK